MLEADAAAPLDRSELADRLHDRTSEPYIVCPPVTVWDRLLQVQLAYEIQRLPPSPAHVLSSRREDATGIASHQPDLPFFMQSGFGRH